MKYRILGKTGIQVSEIGFGCMSLNKTPGNAKHLLMRAFDAGINYFDTADLYDKGENEKLVGTALKPVRQKVILATKVGNQWKHDASNKENNWVWNPKKEYIIKAVEESLKRLQTDYIDLYQLHGGTISDPFDETIEAFELLVQQGKIKYYGISSIRPNVIRRYVQDANIQSVMMQYSLLDRRPEEEILGLLQQQQISVMARGVLAQGLLAGKPPKEYLGHSAAQVKKAQDCLADFEKNDTNLTILALQFALSAPAITSCVVGIRTNEQLSEVLAAANTMKDGVLEAIKTCAPALRYSEHR